MTVVGHCRAVELGFFHSECARSSKIKNRQSLRSADSHYHGRNMFFNDHYHWKHWFLFVMHKPADIRCLWGCGERRWLLRCGKRQPVRFVWDGVDGFINHQWKCFQESLSRILLMAENMHFMTCAETSKWYQKRSKSPPQKSTDWYWWGYASARSNTRNDVCASEVHVPSDWDKFWMCEKMSLFRHDIT